MQRFPFKFVSGLVTHLGYKHCQTKLSPILYSLPVCGYDERRHAFSSPRGPLLKPKSLSILQASVLHTTSSLSDTPKMPKIDLDEVRKGATLMIKSINISDFRKAPKPIQTLGLAGLVPFVFPTLAVLLNGQFLPNLAFAQLAYGCTILAFLGGVKWGFTLPPQSSDPPNWENLSVSVAWPIVAWTSILLPHFLGSLTLMGGIAAAAYMDFLGSGYPAWFKSVRLLLSAVALGSLFLMLFFRLLF